MLRRICIADQQVWFFHPVRSLQAPDAKHAWGLKGRCVTDSGERVEQEEGRKLSYPELGKFTQVWVRQVELITAARHWLRDADSYAEAQNKLPEGSYKLIGPTAQYERGQEMVRAKLQAFDAEVDKYIQGAGEQEKSPAKISGASSRNYLFCLFGLFVVAIVIGVGFIPAPFRELVYALGFGASIGHFTFYVGQKI